MSERVLIIEDEKLIRDMAVQVVASAGYLVDAVASEREAFKYLRTMPSVDIILADIDLVGDEDSEDRGGTRVALTLAEEQHPVAVVATSSKFNDVDSMLIGEANESESPFHEHSTKAWVNDESERASFFEKVRNAYEKVRESQEAKQQAIHELISEEGVASSYWSPHLFPSTEWTENAVMKGTSFFILDNSEFEKLGDKGVTRIIQPIPVWLREYRLEEVTHFVAEIYKLPAVRVSAPDVDTAIMKMVQLIQHLIANSGKDDNNQELYDYTVRKALGRYIDLS
ncbi:MAG: response regulator [Pseudomonadota bacterium]